MEKELGTVCSDYTERVGQRRLQRERDRSTWTITWRNDWHSGKMTCTSCVGDHLEKKKDTFRR